MITISKTAANTTDNTVIYTSHDIEQYNWHELDIATAPTGGAVDAFVSYDGTNYTSAAITWIERNNSVETNSPANAGSYYVVGQFKKMKIQNDGASISQAPAIRIAHSKV